MNSRITVLSSTAVIAESTGKFFSVRPPFVAAKAHLPSPNSSVNSAFQATTPLDPLVQPPIATPSRHVHIVATAQASHDSSASSTSGSDSDDSDPKRRNRKTKLTPAEAARRNERRMLTLLARLHKHAKNADFLTLADHPDSAHQALVYQK